MAEPTRLAEHHYQWLATDLRGAAYLTLLRGRDLARSWLAITGGTQYGHLAGVAVARSLFETGLEAFRFSSTIADTLTSAPKDPATLILFGDGIWVPLFRYVGGEKTNQVNVRENTRNTMSNIKWLRRSVHTEILAESYDAASEYLHSGSIDQRHEQHILQSELLFLMTGASGTLQAYAKLLEAIELVEGIAGQAPLDSPAAVCSLGVDPNIPRHPSWEGA